MQTGDFEAAKACFERSIALQPHAKTFEALGVCLDRLGAAQAAVQALRSAVAANPRSAKSTCLLADLLARTGDTTAARELLGELRQRQPTYGPARELLARLDRSR